METAREKSSNTETVPADIAPERLLALYETMAVIRKAEERLSTLFAAGDVPGFIHLSLGQEAVAAGVIGALAKGDTIASNHRGHGHSLAKGVTLERFFAEIFAKAEGICGGRGGSMHIADLSVGMLGANGIVGAGIPIALGSALAHRVQHTGNIAVAFFGDGARAEGVLHETMNMAALWSVPLLLVCENNGWSEFSPGKAQFAADLLDLAKTFGIRTQRVDGNDVAAVATAADDMVGAVRAARKPALLECVTLRWHGHYEGDAQKYRDEADLRDVRARDPLIVAAAYAQKLGLAAAQLSDIEAAVAERVDAAIAVAQSGTEPSFELALASVYTPAGA